jgi:hypothetical protein
MHASSEPHASWAITLHTFLAVNEPLLESSPTQMIWE